MSVCSSRDGSEVWLAKEQKSSLLFHGGFSVGIPNPGERVNGLAIVCQEKRDSSYNALALIAGWIFLGIWA